MYEPKLIFNIGAIAAALAFNIVLGSVWYGPLFGKRWMKETGFNNANRPDKKEMIKAMIIMLIGAFLMIFVLAHSVQVWRPSVWEKGADQPAYIYGFFAAFFIWLGFFLPVQLNMVVFEKKSWALLAINSGYQFVSLLAVGMILSYWR